MDFKKLIGLETAAAIIGAVIADLVHRYTQLSYSLLIYLAPLLVIAIMLTQIKHRLQIVRSGMQGYYKTLSLDEGFAYWKETETSFGYLGITGASISEYIRGFLHREKDHDMNYRFLLMDPNGEAIKRQVAYKKGYDFKAISPEQKTAIDQEIEIEKKRFDLTLQELKSADQYPKRLKIRIFNEFLPWWMYLIDEKKIIVGFMKNGQFLLRDEQAAAVLTSHKNPQICNLYTSFRMNFERIWESAREA